MAMRTTMATARAVTTAQTPPTAASEVSPHSAFSRKDASMRGRTKSDIRRLTATTTTSGKAASAIGGPPPLGRALSDCGGAHARVRDARAGSHDREHRALRPETLGHVLRDRGHRARVLHELAEQGAQEKDRE